MTGKAVRWLVEHAVLAIHSSLVEAHGGTPGIRDEGLLESALARPQNQYHCEPESTIFKLAASYGFGLSSNHPFVDGNKRIALTPLRGVQALGSRTRPMNNTVSVGMSLMKKRNGRSSVISVPMPKSITTAVAAAASVPYSSTAMNAL